MGQVSPAAATTTPTVPVAPVAPPVSVPATLPGADPQATITRLEQVKSAVTAPGRQDATTAEEVRRAIDRAQAELRRREEEQRQAEEKAKAAEEARRREAERQDRGRTLPGLPAEALRDLTPAQRIRRAAVEGAYAAGDLAPGGLGVDLLVR